MLDISSFSNALASLEKALSRAQQSPGDEELRDACIQRFEYTYELATKMMIKYLEASSPNPREIDTLTFRDILRIASERGLIDSVEAWFLYRKARNQTSHAYDRAEAEEVYAILPRFAEDSTTLLQRLEEKIAHL